MINIDELRQRVEAAEQRFGMIDSSQRRSSEKLIGMMSAIEQDQAQKQVQLDESKALIASMTNENQQLRSMLHSLLLAIEAAGNDQSVEIMREMDSKLSALVEEDAATVDMPEPVAVAPNIEAEPAPLEMAGAGLGEVAVDDSEPEIVASSEPVLGTAPAEMPVEDDVLCEPPGVLPSAVAETVIEDVSEEVAPDAETRGGEAENSEIINKIDAAEAADGVREILERMNREKQQKEAAAQS